MIVKCPHCNEFVFIESINCGIFRHAVFKHNMEPIPPHSSKADCDRLASQTYGCGKPFKIVSKEGVYEIEVCDYI